ncbi:MAG: glucose-6-phosphate isomerase family protein [Candidatus Aenigmarchaeota archaeon]|nr:hypothetical protein [Candidatus Aenigmarchaeota archaeon]MDW8159925.1 glucose-6-phosphate isomerase family protein [Candidatus Aenigmarchaeota archaeon]
MKLHGVVVRGEEKIEVYFPERPVYWERRISELLPVIMDVENAKKGMRFFGDLPVYYVYNLWNGIDYYRKIKNDYKLNFDLTLLKGGVFYPGEISEFFLTYGHVHEKERGEVYRVLKNECMIMLADLKKKVCFYSELKEGDIFFVHPKYAHRLISTGRDCLVLCISPEDAGHNYEIIKGRGFPYHFFLENGWIKIVENKKYKDEFKIRKVFQKNKIDLENLDKIREILYKPNKNEKFYHLKPTL